MADSNAKKLAQLLDANGDVLLTNLDNVNTNLVADTTPQLGGDLDGNGNTIDLSGNTDAMTLPQGTAAQEPTAADYTGAIRFDSDKGVITYSDGTSWNKVSAELAVLSSVSGNIYAGAVGGDLTLTGTGFLSANLVVNFVQSSDAIDVDVTVTPTSDTTATVTVPAAVYNNVTAGNAVSITVTNSDNSTSDAVNKTCVGLPSGGTISTSGDYRYHKFTSSGTFTCPTNWSNTVEYLIIAGGGGGGDADCGGGGGAGGLRQSTASTTAGSYSITVGGAGSGSSSGQGGNGGNSSGFSITSLGGGGGGKGNTGASVGLSGGSGGGGGWGGQSGGAGTSGQGNPGGSGAGQPGSGVSGGGGGGAGGAAANLAGTSNIGHGAPGSQYSAWATATSSGDNGYYASGGSAGTDTTSSNVQDGGGGAGGRGNPRYASSAGQTNTGGGGGGGEGFGGGGGSNGGSGIVLVRYDLTSLS